MISPDGNDHPFVLDVQDQLTRRNGTEEADRNLGQMWARCRAFDLKWADHFRKRTALRLLCIPAAAAPGWSGPSTSWPTWWSGSTDF